MKFGKPLLSPDYNRPPAFRTFQNPSINYDFDCSNCNQSIFISFANIIDSAWNWKENLTPITVEAINQYFDMNVVGKSPDGGWASIAFVVCKACKKEFVVYSGVNESSNSVYKVTVQGIAEVSSD